MVIHYTGLDLKKISCIVCQPGTVPRRLLGPTEKLVYSILLSYGILTTHEATYHIRLLLPVLGCLRMT
jgi:hypothetical protein